MVVMGLLPHYPSVHPLCTLHTSSASPPCILLCTLCASSMHLLHNPLCTPLDTLPYTLLCTLQYPTHTICAPSATPSCTLPHILCAPCTHPSMHPTTCPHNPLSTPPYTHLCILCKLLSVLLCTPLEYHPHTSVYPPCTPSLNPSVHPSVY